MVETPKIMPVAKCGAVSHCKASPADYVHSLPGYGQKTKARIAAAAMADLEAKRAIDVKTHTDNAAALANNAEVRRQVIAFMEAIGMPGGYTTKDTKSRARFPKSIRNDAGYISDLHREVITNDGFGSATATYESLLKRYREYEAAAEREAEEASTLAARVQEAERAKRLADMELATVIIRYKLDVMATWSDVLRSLRKLHQRLDLAIAMMETRADWSEGYYRVTDALERFTIHTNEDKDIAADVLGCARSGDDGDIDGRVFRDTGWNYDRIVESVRQESPALVDDVMKAYERSRRDD